MAWLIAFAQLDQYYVQTVSLRSVMGEDAFKEGRETGHWDFTLGEMLFPEQAHVRLRGLSAFTIGPDLDDGVWYIAAKVPGSSFCRHLDGTTVQLNQSGIPVTRLGRVTLREHPRAPDVVGISSLHNTSPYGLWKVGALKTSSRRKALTEIDDLDLDLHVAVRSLGIRQ